MCLHDVYLERLEKRELSTVVLSRLHDYQVLGERLAHHPCPIL